MKKSCIFGLIAFLAAAAGVAVAVMMYLKKKEKNLAEYEEFLYSEDYLADYMPQDDCNCCSEAEFCEEECCAEECCEEGCCAENYSEE